VNQPPAYQALAYQAPIPQTQSVSQTNFERYVKANDAVMRNMKNQGQNVQYQLANLMDMLSKFMSSNTASSSGSGTLPSNTITNPKEDLKGITTQSGAAYQGPQIPTPSKVVKQRTEVTRTSAPMPNLHSSIPYPSRRDNERRRDQANEQIEKFYKIFKEMSFEISFMDALTLMPKFASTLKALIGNKEKLSEMARTTMNEHCSAVILNKLPKKLGDPAKFLIPYEFPGMDECLALADLGASINLMPLSVWKGFSLSELTPTCMTLELTDRSVSKPIGIAKDISVKVGVFHFPADFVVVDFKPDPRVPLIIERYFLKTGRALIDVYEGELTLRIRKEAITYNLDQTVRYSANYDQMTANKIDVICEIYSQEVLGFSDVIASGNPTSYDDPIVSTTSPTLTPFGDSDFLLFEKVDAFLSLEDDPNSPKFDPSYYDPGGDILLLESILNSEPLPPLPNHEQYLPSYKKELKVCKAKTGKSFVDEPPEVELKDLTPHLEYAFLEGDKKLPVIIAKELGDEEKSALIKVLKSHKRAIAWKLSDIQGGFIVVENEENGLIPTRLVTGWRDCPDCEVSRALSFCLSFTRASHPQHHFGNPNQHLAFKDLDQVNKEAFDEYEIKHQMAMIAIKARKFEKKYRRPVQFDSREAARFDKKLAKCFKCKKTCHFARECRSQVSQESTNYKNYKKKEAAKDASESLVLVVIDGSQGVNWDKQLQENTIKPGVLRNYGFVAVKGTNSTVPADDAVPADDVPASAFIFAEPTIPTDRVIAAEASVLAVDGIPANSEFAMISLPSKKLLDQASGAKQDLMVKLENEKSMNAKWLSTSKNLHKLVDSSMTARTKRGLGFTKVNHYKGVPPPMNGNYMPTSTSPDTDESPKHYGKQTSESTKIKSTSKNFKFLFDFSDRSLVPTASDSCVENARPNNVVHDSDEFTSRTSTSGSEEQVDNVCIPQEDLSSSTSLGFDVQSSDSMCNKF
nr:reverse transcriptase domain-containing protein [Tanacetum cinerariifolium]